MPETDTIPVSASITSTGLGIRYIGDYAYAASGTYEAKTSTQIIFDFTSGAGYIVGEFECMGVLQYVAANIGDGKNTAYKISFNDVVISLLKIGSAGEQMPTKERQRVIIPPSQKLRLRFYQAAPLLMN